MDKSTYWGLVYMAGMTAGIIIALLVFKPNKTEDKDV